MRRRRSSQSSPVRDRAGVTTLAFAGAGHISAVHGLAAQATANVTITKVASRTPARAAERAEQMGAQAATYADLPGGADVVLVCTPPAEHVADVIQALQGDAAVIVEKPMTTTLDDADRLVEAAAARGGAVGYAENLAFAPVVVKARAMIGQLGPIHHLDVRVLQERPNWGDFLTDVWGGGVLFDLGPHPIAVAMLLAAPARPVHVVGHLAGATDIAADEHAEITIKFDSGLAARVVVSWREPSRDARVWDLQAASASGVLRMELVPDPGLEIDGEPVALPAPRSDLPSPRLEQMGYTGQLETFIADFAAGREPEMSAAFGRDVLEVICAGYSSAGNGGRPIALPFTGHRHRTPQQLWLD